MRCYLEKDIDDIVKIVERTTHLVSGLKSADTIMKEVSHNMEYIKRTLLAQPKER